MFSVLREKLDLVEVAEKFIGETFAPIGDQTFAPESKECPLCQHKDCFRIKSDGADSLFKCFSCDKTGDVTTLVSELKGISNVEAARLLAKQYHIQLPNDYSPMQEIFNLAGDYYSTCLKDAGPFAELGGLTPIEYQTQVRRHTLESLTKFHIGWSDGKLVEYLEAFGVDKGLLLESGLVNKKGYDFLPSKSFIYPHLIKGRVSHFTFKDPLKQKEYQLPNKNKLNAHSFYWSDSTHKEGPIIVVEGENDAISVDEAGWTSGIVCCNGSISSSQLEWLSTNLAGRDIITIFDTDPAGDKYREKVGKLRSRFKSLIQVKLDSSVNDIDVFLKAGGDLFAAIEIHELTLEDSGDNGDIEVEGSESINLLEKKGAYYKIKFKEGVESHLKISNFTLELKNIYISGAEREREVIIVREDGRRSDPVRINSDAKVSLKPFKTLVANAVDASFYGREEDMSSMWEFVYSKSSEKVVYLPEVIGRVEEFRGWLFGDCFISDAGAVYHPDDSGVIWVTNHSVGIKPVPLNTPTNSYKEEVVNLPKVKTYLTEEEVEALLGSFISNYARNTGDMGNTLTALGWMWASAYTTIISKHLGFFPLLYFWGSKGQGKSTIIKWLLSIYDMEERGYTSFNQLGSGVSFSRKLSYFSSLPLCIDEMRADGEASRWSGVFRGWYDRVGKSVGDRNSFGIKDYPVRSTIIFGGQDQFGDPAARSRCILFRIPQYGREMVETYNWFENNKVDFPAIGNLWISNKDSLTKDSLTKDFADMDTAMRAMGVEPRVSRNWAFIAVFGKKLADKYVPSFNYMEYLVKSIKDDSVQQQEDETILQFWEIIEGMQSEERPRITSDHLRRDGSQLIVWFAEIFRLFEKDMGYNNTKEKFSKRAVLEAMREEKYFIKEDRVKLGMSENIRRAIVLDLTKAPEVVQNIANFLG